MPPSRVALGRRPGSACSTTTWRTGSSPNGRSCSPPSPRPDPRVRRPRDPGPGPTRAVATVDLDPATGRAWLSYRRAAAVFTATTRVDAAPTAALRADPRRRGRRQPGHAAGSVPAHVGAQPRAGVLRGHAPSRSDGGRGDDVRPG